MSWGDRLKEYTSFHGRLRRNQWFRRQFILSIVGSLMCLPLMLLAMQVFNQDAVTQIISLTAAQAPVFYCTYSLAARRFHDVGLSAWWLAPLIGYQAFVLAGFTEARMPSFAVHVVFVLVLLAVLFWPSAKGESRFGPPNTDPD